MLCFLAVFQAFLLYLVFRLPSIEKRPDAAGSNPEIEFKKRQVEALYMEGQRGERKIVGYCAAVVFGVLLIVALGKQFFF